MNASSIYIGLAIAALIALPFIIGALRGRAKEKTITREFIETGLKYGIDISETETWNDRVIGLDSVGKKLLFRHTLKAEFTETLIDLNLVADCTSETKFLKTAGEERVIESIQLIFKMKNGRTDALSIYHADLDMNVYSEVQIAEKWTQKVRELLS